MEDQNKNSNNNDTTVTTTNAASNANNSNTDAKPASDNTADTTTATPTKPDTSHPPSSRFPILPFIAGILTTVLVWQLYSVVTSTTSLSDAGYPNPIATINGEAVDQALFEQNVSETLSEAAARGLNTSDEAVRNELETQSLDIIINTRLLVAAAEEAGYEASDEEVAEKIAELENQFGGAEALDEQLTLLNLDRDRLAADIREQIIVDKLLENDVLSETVDVTEAEITEVYNELQAAGQELPPLESVRDAIVAQIQQRKQQSSVEAYLETLRAKADIEINL